MREALIAGLLAGYGIAMPVGAVSALLMSLAARVSLRTGAAAALGVATADGLYALLAAVGGAGAARLLAPVAGPLRWTAGAALIALALRTAVAALRRRGAQGAGRPEGALAASPARAYAGLLGLTLLNPMTVVYFGALVLGQQAGRPYGLAAGLLFASAAFAASASWQLLVAGGGAALGRLLSGPTGRLVTALVSSGVVLFLAVRLLLS